MKWTETRSENFLATIHGRDHIEKVEMAANRDGKITGVRSVVHAGMGAYLSTAAPGVPTILHGLMYSGPYALDATRADIYGVFTNTTPVDAYRGAGRPEATFLLERLMDLAAAELDLDPVEIRRRNLIPKFDNSHDVATGLTYDSGDYAAALDLGPGPGGLRRAAGGTGRRPGTRTLYRNRRIQLLRNLRAGAVASRRCRRFRRRAVGKRRRPLSPVGQGQRLCRRLAPRPGRGNHVRPNRFRGPGRAGGRCGNHPRRHRQHADGLGDLRQPHHGGGRRRPDAGAGQD